MAKTFTSSMSAALSGNSNKKFGILLSNVLKKKPSDLTVNPLNTEYFRQESQEYFERLEKDIRERGVLVPLIVQKQNEKTIVIAGHNRLKIALKLQLPEIPVQYIESKLTEEQEREFVVKDNLLRRQFSNAEWIEIYRKLYPNFDERVQERPKGRPSKKGDTVTLSQKGEPLTTSKIAQDTGQTRAAVKQQFARLRKEQIKKIAAKKTTASSNFSSSKREQQIDTEALKTFRAECKKLLRANLPTRRKAIEELRTYLHTMESSLPTS
jgi:hypothetical protein